MTTTDASPQTTRAKAIVQHYNKTGHWITDQNDLLAIEAEAQRLTVERLLQRLDTIAGPFDVIHDARSTIRAALAQEETRA